MKLLNVPVNLSCPNCSKFTPVELKEVRPGKEIACSECSAVIVLSGCDVGAGLEDAEAAISLMGGSLEVADIPDHGRADIAITWPETGYVENLFNVAYEITGDTVFVYLDAVGTRGPRPKREWCKITPYNSD